MGIRYIGGIEDLLSNCEQSFLELDITRDAAVPAPGVLCYVSQDNYLIAERDALKNPTLYCDSATSCIIIIVTGRLQTGRDGIAISHLSHPGRFNYFFGCVQQYFSGDICVYAAGANPPEPCKKSDGTYDYTALNNALQVSNWIVSAKDRIRVCQASMRFGIGNPAIYSNNLDCFGINMDTIAVSNQRFYLTDVDRDPTNGVQTLFCMFGNPSFVRDQRKLFAEDEIKTLVVEARKHGFQQAADMDDETILKTYSSTPDFEVPWFCSTIRTAGVFVRDYR